jgi:hypothetical protein
MDYISKGQELIPPRNYALRQLFAANALLDVIIYDTASTFIAFKLKKYINRKLI